MKHIQKLCALFVILVSISAAGYAQTPDSLGLPGDNLNLYGVLSLFKDSKNVEDFEKKLNTPDNKVNNLDLDNDGKIDYIRVKDYGENGIHSLVLQDPISATEAQDLAIIEIEQQGNNNAHIQIVGDEDLYGKDYIIEPQDQQQTTPVNDDTYNQGASSGAVMINVWAWPSVEYIYGPSYVYWNSPWYWGYYPAWWSPWSPIGYYSYWNGMYPYRVYHHRVYANHIIVAQNIYYKQRQASPTVHNNIEHHVYNGPRTGGKSEGQPTKNNIGGPRGKDAGKTTENNPKNVTGPRQQMGGKQPINNQPKQNLGPRQQNIKQQQGVKQNQALPKQQEGFKQQTEPRRQEQQMSKQQEGFQQQAQPKMQQQEMPRQQQQAPRQQATPHNMGGGGGGHIGGGGGGRRR